MDMVDTEIALSTTPIQDIRSFRPAETTMLGCLLDAMICSFRPPKPHIAIISKPECRPTNSREDDKGRRLAGVDLMNIAPISGDFG